MLGLVITGNASLGKERRGSARMLDSETVATSILSGLTKAEAEGVLLAATRHSPALSFAVQGLTAGIGEDPGMYEVVVAADDFTRYGDVVERLVAELLPPRLRLQAAETEIARLLAQMLLDVDVDQKATEICALLEWRHVPYLLGLNVDGFSPDSIHLYPRAVALAGRCFFFVAPFTDYFEAELGLDDEGALNVFELRFGDLTTRTRDELIPDGTLDRPERVVAGYHALSRKIRSDAADGKWAFEITKRVATNEQHLASPTSMSKEDSVPDLHSNSGHLSCE